MLAIREDVHIEWALLGGGQLTNSTNDIQISLDNATKALVDLRDKGLEIAFNMLGYSKTKVASDVVQSHVSAGYTQEHHVTSSVVDDSTDRSGVIPLQCINTNTILSPIVTIKAEQPISARQDDQNDKISTSTADSGLLPRFVTP